MFDRKLGSCFGVTPIPPFQGWVAPVRELVAPVHVSFHSVWPEVMTEFTVFRS